MQRKESSNEVAAPFSEWLWEETRVPKVVGSNHIYLLKNCIVCWKKTEINKKEAGVAHFKVY